MKTYHMGAAMSVLDSAEKEFLHKKVENSQLGPMGATVIETYRRADGATMRMIRSNGGCTLEIDE